MTGEFEPGRLQQALEAGQNSPVEPEFNQPLEALPLGGLGLHIVRLLTEGADYSRVNGRNITRLTLRLSEPDPE